jgi:putative membrane protein
MKTILRNIIIYTFALFVLPLIVPGVTIEGGLATLLIGAGVLTLLFLILKPILNIISFPVNLITVGIFNIFINALLVYLLTVFVTQITVSAFTYHNVTFAGFSAPDMAFNTFFAYLFTAFVLSVIAWFGKWLMN